MTRQIASPKRTTNGAGYRAQPAGAQPGTAGATDVAARQNRPVSEVIEHLVGMQARCRTTRTRRSGRGWSRSSGQLSALIPDRAGRPDRGDARDAPPRHRAGLPDAAPADSAVPWVARSTLVAGTVGCWRGWTPMRSWPSGGRCWKSSRGRWGSFGRCSGSAGRTTTPRSGLLGPLSAAAGPGAAARPLGQERPADLYDSRSVARAAAGGRAEPGRDGAALPGGVRAGLGAGRPDLVGLTGCARRWSGCGPACSRSATGAAGSCSTCRTRLGRTRRRRPRRASCRSTTTCCSPTPTARGWWTRSCAGDSSPRTASSRRCWWTGSSGDLEACAGAGHGDVARSAAPAARKVGRRGHRRGGRPPAPLPGSGAPHHNVQVSPVADPL